MFLSKIHLIEVSITGYLQLDYLRKSEQVIVVFSAISWREQINIQWDDDQVRFVLDQHA
jgi:hypothetical protein